jgi:hypothetical protein
MGFNLRVRPRLLVSKRVICHTGPQVLASKFDAPFFSTIPRVPGVYFFIGASGRILYIGKAKSLRNRILSHRRSGHPMLPLIRHIRWEICRSEKDALLREDELLHAIRPPHNIAGTWEEHYLFVGLRTRALKVDFHLDGDFAKFHPECEVFGCFRYRRRTKNGYTALIRLLWACHFKGRSFSYPSKITKDSPPWRYSLELERRWHLLLTAFFRGRSLKLLRELSEALLENKNIPEFMVPSLQEDINQVKEFYRLGPRFTRAQVLTHRSMDQLIESSV